jgi:hypothetical protein
MLCWRRQRCSNQHNQRRLHRDHPALTRDIDRAKRNMRALLERLLDQAGISFPEWAVQAPIGGGAPPTRSGLVRRQVNGRVAPGVEARVAVDGLLFRGLLAPADNAQAGSTRTPTTGKIPVSSPRRRRGRPSTGPPAGP